MLVAAAAAVVIGTATWHVVTRRLQKKAKDRGR